MGLMEGRGPHHIHGKFKDLYGQALIANWRVWPLAQVCTLKSASVSAKPHPVNQLPFHALGISSSVPEYMWGILDVVPLITELRVSFSSDVFSSLRTHWWVKVKMQNKIAVTPRKTCLAAQDNTGSFAAPAYPLLPL